MPLERDPRKRAVYSVTAAARINEPRRAHCREPWSSYPNRSSLNSFFLEGGAMNSIEKSAIITGEYWLLVYRTCPNFAQ